jgi:hypothetical protein
LPASEIASAESCGTGACNGIRFLKNRRHCTGFPASSRVRDGPPTHFTRFFPPFTPHAAGRQAHNWFLPAFNVALGAPEADDVLPHEAWDTVIDAVDEKYLPWAAAADGNPIRTTLRRQQGVSFGG